MFKELSELTITNGMRYYRTEENRPDIATLVREIGNAKSTEEAVAMARQIVNADRINHEIDGHEQLIELCMKYIKSETEKGMLITKKLMASYLHEKCGVAGSHSPWGWSDPCGATEYALERLVKEGYLKKVKVRHKVDKYWWRTTILDAYEVV